MGQQKRVFLDEATSALDEAEEMRLYALLRDRLPRTVMISIGHRSTLWRFHARSGPSWRRAGRRLVLKRPALLSRTKRTCRVIVALVLDEYSRQIASLAIRHQLPTISGPKDCAEAGGLMACGPDYSDLFRRAAVYVD